MKTVVFNGEKEAEKRELVLAKKVSGLKVKPKLVSIVVGDDKVSHLYVDLKGKAAVRVGIGFEKLEFEKDIKSSLLIDRIRAECKKPDVTGVMVQMPLPENLKIHEEQILSSIEKIKDVDGLNPGESKFLPATVKAVMSIIELTGVDLVNKKVVVVGRSRIVGRPLVKHLRKIGVDVKVGHSKIKDLGRLTRSGDVLISATGKAGLIRGEMVKKGSIVIDVGEPRGDVNFEEVELKTGFITPVPGGVGPMTVVSLLENVAEAVL